MAWNAIANLTGDQGPAGTTTIRGATDYDNSVAPQDGQLLLWVASNGKYTPRYITPSSIGAAATGHTHAEADVTGLVSDLAGKAPTTRRVTAGTGLTGGGDLSADRTLAVAYGSSSGSAVQGNDARVTADQAASQASIRTLGTGAQQAAAGNHNHDNRYPRGLIARAVRNANTTTGMSGTTTYKVLEVSAAVVAGRAYQVTGLVGMYANGNIAVSMGDAFMRYTTDGSAPTLTSTVLEHTATFLPAGGMVSSAFFNELYLPTTSHTARFLITAGLSIGSTSGGIYAPAAADWLPRIHVYDVGLAVSNTGVTF